MVKASEHNISQLFNLAPDSYFERTSRPVYAIFFLLPFIVFYELGIIFIRTDVLNQSVVLVEAFVWLQRVLGYLGFGGKFVWIAPPLAVILILTALQVTSKKRWNLWFGDFVPMAIECVLLAIPLIVFSLFLNSPATPKNNINGFDGNTVSRHLCEDSGKACCNWQYEHNVLTCSSVSDEVGGGQLTTDESLLANVVTGIGAGIYEELVFRLILICLLMLLFQDVLRLEHKVAVVFSVSISAAMFSAHHHINFVSGQLNPTDPFNLAKFVFRAVAGVYFAVLFAIRGFGITAGTHAFYNIIAVFINTAFFND